MNHSSMILFEYMSAIIISSQVLIQQKLNIKPKIFSVYSKHKIKFFII
jgi:hypothetical protein